MLETLERSTAEPLTESAPREVAIQAEHLRHSYDGKRLALNDVSFSVNKGEVFGLLGKNGAGKTSLIKILTTLMRPTSGKLRVLGRDASRDGKAVREQIGVVQQGESFDYASVQGNFDIYGTLWGIPRRERLRRREDLIATFGLEPVRKRRAFDLSGGERRRLQVAREMIHDMEILFLDEPTVGLDVIMRRKLLDLIRGEVRRGLTVVFTTHNLEEADYLCDSIAVIDSGKILALDTVENLKKLYGGKKTVEATIGNGGAKRFFEMLEQRLGPDSVKINRNSALILTDNPKDVLQTIIDLSQGTGSQIEWLNVRSNTLEDVFIKSVSGGA